MPEELRAFIIRYIDSIAQLEALLLLRNNPADNWDVAKTAARLYTSEAEAEAVLTHLAEAGFLARDGHNVKYSPADDELARLVDELAEAYARQLIPVTNLIHAKHRRIRQFADAFKFRKGS